MQMSIPLDNGYIRRECPNCEREFKWFADPDQAPSEGPPPNHYFCPYCGEPAGLDSWWTKKQLEVAQAIAMGQASQTINKELKNLERKSRGGMVNFKVKSSMKSPNPGTLDEPSDMVVVESPCHPEEPIKVVEDWNEPFHCLVCGEEFVLD